MPQLDIQKIKGIIWDLDNTLYRFDRAFELACSIASARAAIAMGVPMSEEDAIENANEAFYTHGYSGYFFEHDYGVCREAYHFKYHEMIDEKILDVNRDMQGALKELDMPHVILTNGSQEWAKRVLKHQGLDPWFPDDRIVAQEDADFTPKARGPRGFEVAVQKLGLDHENILMVDDLEKNLRIPKDMGMQTVLVHHGRAVDPLPDFVDQSFDDTLTLIHTMVEARLEEVFTPPHPPQTSAAQ